jgi:Uri superfamily endonuclease
MLDEFRTFGFGTSDLLPKTGKHFRWNVDYLLDQPSVALVGAYLIRSEKRIEAEIGKLLENDPSTVVFAPGLGANDIRGNTHLLRVDADDRWWDRLIQKLSRFLRSIGI